MMPTSTDLTFAVAGKVPADTEAVLIFIPLGARPAEGAAAGAVIDEATAKSVARLIEAGVSNGKARQVRFDLEELKGGRNRRVYVAGLGPAEAITTESIRQAAAAATRAIIKQRQQKVVVSLPAIAKLTLAQVAEAIAVGSLLAAFHFAEYKGTAAAKEEEEKNPQRVNITVLADRSSEKQLKQAIERATIIADAQNFARTVASRPGNDVNPPELASIARQLANETGLGCTVLDEKKMLGLGMGGILAVGAGSIQTPPRMIVLEHKPARPSNKKPLMIVGKAITFDAGGISIKPAEKMGKMIFDKCGGMAVLGAMCALARLRSRAHVVGILASAENTLSSRAYRPGDILRMFNGVTVEVTNTDAEGRLVLGDALSWGIERYQPQAVVDLATLTGGVITALGRNIAGIMSNDDAIVAELISAGEDAGEKMWRLPLGEEQRDQMKSDPADIVNSAGREAHPLQGGAFLSFFVPADKSVAWAHLDIAGVADTEKELPLYAKGATGWGVRTLLNWIGVRTGG
ncbi:MAG TPA: leucyl aminopeptidase [Tepidisphaeraceae bacterium]|nr:leucyl aminopeptidase [Tepidisphaeraceae bacterium]